MAFHSKYILVRAHTSGVWTYNDLLFMQYYSVQTIMFEKCKVERVQVFMRF